jgi:hypothetical protein
MSAILEAKLDEEYFSAEVGDPQPSWLAQVAKLRDFFEGVAFAFDLDGIPQVHSRNSVWRGSHLVS